MQSEYPITFGKYLLLHRIAVGGMAEVFRAKLIGPKGFEKKLAIKRILPEYSQDDEFVQMFVDEARISSHLHHSNIVPVFDFGQVDHQFYIAMELIEGTNLKNLFFRALKQGKTFSRPLIYYMISRLASALDYAHQVKVDGEDHYLQLVHRDVSPQNVLISRRGEIKITDFGIAKAAIKLTQTQPGKIQGKYSYMSPEQAVGKNIDHRSDIFSLGIIFFELLSGKKVYGSSDSIDRYKQATKADIPRLSQVVSNIPHQVDELVMQMLAKDPKQRPGSCAEVVSTLSQFIANHREDLLMKELGEITTELFPVTASERKAEKSITKNLLAEQAESAIDWNNRALAKTASKSSLTNSDATQRDFALWLWCKQHKLRATALLSVMIIGTALLGWTIANFFADTPTYTRPKPKPTSVNEVTDKQPAPQTPDTNNLEMSLVDIENEIERIEKHIETLSKKNAKQSRTSSTTETTAEKPKCPTGMQWIKGGLMSVGSSPSDPSRQELLEKAYNKQNISGFCIDTYEFPNKKGQSPMTNVSFPKAQSLCASKAKKLCSDLQWERACKGAASARANQQFPYGPTLIEKKCNVHKHELENNHLHQPPSSGAFPDCKSAEGVYDLSGSVFEWTTSSGIFETKSKITKGGSFKSSEYASRCSSIYEAMPDTRKTDIGFRCCQ